MQTALVARLSNNWVFLVLGGALLALFAGILIANDGVFVYTLDDPYIHLQFSTQLWRGHFGLVPEEISSPSSSVLWPLLLAPFSTSVFHSYVPLLINIAASFASLALWRHAFRRFILQTTEARFGHVADALALVAILVTNTPGLVFSGMEHSLQVTATLAALVGAIEFIETRRIRWWLLAGIIAGPLLRYENLPISATALAVLFAGGAWGWAAIGAAAIAAGLGAFAAVSVSLGLPAIPGSLQLKSPLGGGASGMLESMRQMIKTFLIGLFRSYSPLNVVPLIALLALRPFMSDARLTVARWLLLLGVVASASLQLVFGGHLNLGRYDCFALSACLLCIAYFYRALLATAVERARVWQVPATAFILLFAILPGASGALFLTPVAAQDIYRQQWQMRQFLATLGDEGVAVNDVGLTSYHSGQRVLDLIGLGSEDVRRRRIKGQLAGQSLRAMMVDRNLHALLIYERWFQPEDFQDMEVVARFDLGRNAVSAAARTVTLFGVDSDAAARLRAKAIDFAPSMPRGTTLEIVAPPKGVLR